VQPLPSVLVPVGVLKRNGSTAAADASGAGLAANTPPRTAENKSVIFSDGIRPGGDLTELDGSNEHRPLGRRPLKVKNRRLAVRGARGAAVAGDVCSSKLPAEGLPLVSGMVPVVYFFKCVYRYCVPYSVLSFYLVLLANGTGIPSIPDMQYCTVLWRLLFTYR
jgi:hypothetical protein